MKVTDLSFVIISPMRCGSSLICKLLDAHPNINCKLEYCAKYQIEELYEKYNTRDAIQALTLVMNSDKSWETNSGFKFLFHHERSDTEELYKLLLQTASIKKIMLTRNPLESYISLKTAQKTNEFWLGRKTSEHKIKFVKENFLEYTDRCNNEYNYALSTVQGPMTTVDYKEICNTSCLRELHRFLEVSYIHAPLPEWTLGQSTKQNHTQMSYRVENFTEMVDYVSTTPYKKYLV